MQTTIYLIRHGATVANLEHPPRLQGRGLDGELAAEGIAQAKMTRDFLRHYPLDLFFSSPMRRACQTAEIIARPHEKPCAIISDLMECNVGNWEGRSWEDIRAQDADAYQQFMNDPGNFGYPNGESFADVARRVAPVFQQLMDRHAGKKLLVVGHHVVNRVYLAGLLGLSPSQARRISLDNCGISVVAYQHGQARLTTLNATFHLEKSD